MLTFNPRASRIAPKDAAAMPFPSEDTTPPVTQIYRVMGHRRFAGGVQRRLLFENSEKSAITYDGTPVYWKCRSEGRSLFRAHDILRECRGYPYSTAARKRSNASGTRNRGLVVPRNLDALFIAVRGPCVGNPQVSDGDQFVVCIEERNAIAPPR